MPERRKVYSVPLVRSETTDSKQEHRLLSYKSMDGLPDGDGGFKLGFGTGHLREYDTCFEVVTAAIETGYRHIDTARAYQNERAIGDAVAQSDVDHDSVFLATKVHSEQLDYKDCIESVYNSRDALGVETIDLVYVHWPAHEYDPSETLAALSSLQSTGTIRHIGLSNFTVELVKAARNATTAPIFAIQTEMHPYLQQNSLHEYTSCHGIRLFAHTPLCQGAVINDSVLSSIARRRGISEAQVALAWLLGKDGVGAITATHGEYLQENHAAQSVTLDADERQKIDSIERQHRCVDYEFAPWNTTSQ